MWHGIERQDKSYEVAAVIETCNQSFFFRFYGPKICIKQKLKYSYTVIYPTLA